MTPEEWLGALGLIFLLGMTTDYIGSRTSLPRITLLIIFGIVIGKHGFGLLPEELTGHFELITNIAMLMIGFLLGGKLTRDFLKTTASVVFSIATWAAVSSAALVTGGLYLLQVPLPICIILGCISAATDPAATTEAIRDTGIDSDFTRKLFTIVALDDLVGIIIFGIGLSIISIISTDGDFQNMIIMISWELIGAVLLGLFLGLPGSVLTGRINEGEPMLMEALALVFLCGGLALWLEVSIIISALTMGAVISNCATHHQYPFHAIENIEWPVLVLFFTLAGASLHITELVAIGLIGMVYMICRTAGKALGAWIGGTLSHSDTLTRRWSGLAMLPQAGIAMGMALIAADHFPEYRQLILSVVISTTILFEIAGPVVTGFCVRKVRKTVRPPK
jgi:NhaP-type Na+/H+ or K+/H+ antiporter